MEAVLAILTFVAGYLVAKVRAGSAELREIHRLQALSEQERMRTCRNVFYIMGRADGFAEANDFARTGVWWDSREVRH